MEHLERLEQPAAPRSCTTPGTAEQTPQAILRNRWNILKRQQKSHDRKAGCAAAAADCTTPGTAEQVEHVDQVEHLEHPIARRPMTKKWVGQAGHAKW